MLCDLKKLHVNRVTLFPNQYKKVHNAHVNAKQIYIKMMPGEYPIQIEINFTCLFYCAELWPILKLL